MLLRTGQQILTIATSSIRYYHPSKRYLLAEKDYISCVNFSGIPELKARHFMFRHLLIAYGFSRHLWKCFLWPAVLLWQSSAVAGTIYTVETLPNPKSSSGYHYVSNPDQVLDSTTVAHVDSLLKELEQTTTCQVAVAVIQSIGDEVPKTFATRLFNYWGIGDREKDNGLLILMVIDQRSIEFETGKGLEGILPDITCKHIQETYMIPYAKAGNYDASVVGGIKAVIMHISDPRHVEEVKADHDSSFLQSPASPLTHPVPDIVLVISGVILAVITFLFRPRRKKGSQPEYLINNKNDHHWLLKTILINMAFPAVWLWSQITYDSPVTMAELLLASYIFIIILLMERRLRLNHYIDSYYASDRHAKYVAYTRSHRFWQITYFLFPVPFLIYKLFKDQKLNQLRNAPYNCEQCGNRMQKLEEQSDDQYLSPGQLLEEQLHSVDYDVWHCFHCGHQLQFSYINYRSRYAECKYCHAKTSYIKSRNTLVSPTYTSAGSGEKIIDCMHCHKQDREPYTIPMLQRSSSSSGSSGSSSGSSGGSSWGGGSSGGGGAGSKW